MKELEDDRIQQDRQYKNPFKKVLSFLSRGLSWLLILPILSIASLYHLSHLLLVALHLPVQSMPDKQ